MSNRNFCPPPGQGPAQPRIPRRPRKPPPRTPPDAFGPAVLQPRYATAQQQSDWENSDAIEPDPPTTAASATPRRHTADAFDEFADVTGTPADASPAPPPPRRTAPLQSNAPANRAGGDAGGAPTIFEEDLAIAEAERQRGEGPEAEPAFEDLIESADGNLDEMPHVGRELLANPHLVHQLVAIAEPEYFTEDNHVRVILRAVRQLHVDGTENATPDQMRAEIRRQRNGSRAHAERGAADDLLAAGAIEGLIDRAQGGTAGLEILQNYLKDAPIRRACESIDDEISILSQVRHITVAPEAVEALPDPADIWQPFPVGLMPAVIAPFITETAASKTVDPAMIALPAFAVMAAALGCDYAIAAKDDWQEYPIFWTPVIAEQGSVKTQALSAVWNVTHRRQKQAHDAFMAAQQDPAPDVISTQAIDGPAPHYQHLLTNNFTIASLADDLQYSRRGILIAMPELAAFLTCANQFTGGRGSDIQKLLELFDGGPTKIDRKKNKNPQFVPRWGACVTGTIQPKVFHSVLSGVHESNGMLSRNLIAQPPRAGDGWSDATVSTQAQNGWEGIIDSLYNLPQSTTDQPILIPLSCEARALFRDRCRQNAAQVNSEPDERCRGMLSKMKGHILKIAGVIHAVDRIAANQRVTQPITADTMTRAMGLADWFEHEARRVYRQRATISAQDEQSRVRETIQLVTSRPGQTITGSQLARMQYGRFKGNTRDAEAFLKELAEKRLGTITNAGRAGNGIRFTLRRS